MASETFSPFDERAHPDDSERESNVGEDSARPRRRLGNWQTPGLRVSAPESDLELEPAKVETSDSREEPREARLRGSASISQRRLDRDRADSPPAPALEAPRQADAAAPVDATRLEALIDQIQTNPDDVAALSALAGALLDHGLIQESLDIKRRLHGLQTAVSATPSTPQPEPDRAASPDPDPLPAIRAPRTRRGGTTQLLLDPNLPSMVTSFPLDQLGFTIPLPGEAQLGEAVRETVAQSGRELIAGQVMAALDSCILVIERAPDFTPIYIRLAEIHAHRRSGRRARSQAEAVIRLCDVEGRRDDARWMAERVLLHASASDFDALTTLVDLLIESKRVAEAARYGAKLIEISLEAGKSDQALAVSHRLCAMAPADDRLALENVILLAQLGDTEGAIDRWERATAAGASVAAAKSSLAALIAKDHELDHWQLLAESIDEMRSTTSLIDSAAYLRTAAALPPNPVHHAGRAMLQAAAADPTSDAELVTIMNDPLAGTLGRSLAAVAIAQKFDCPERLNALQTAVHLLQTPLDLGVSNWITLVGAAPRVEDLEGDLGESLLRLGDEAGAVNIFKRAHARDAENADISEMLADAHVRAGQLGFALAILDELSISHRSAGRLPEMAQALRKMSALAPANVKVKSRLIEAYLHRGFVEEARTELLARAEIEESGGLLRDAVESLRRAADLSWALNRPAEAFDLYQRLIALAPDDAANRSSLVNLYLQEGRVADAAEQQRAVVEIALRTGSQQEAIAALHQVIGLTPDDSTAYYQLGALLSEMGEHHQAEKVFRRLALMNPGDDLARTKMAEMAHLADSRPEPASVPAR